MKAIDLFTHAMQLVAHLTKVEIIIASCVYLACRVEGYPRLLDEVSLYSGIDVKEIGKMQKVLLKKLSLSIGIIKPMDILHRMAGQLPFDYHQRQIAYDFCQSLHHYELFLSTPPQLVVAGVLAWVFILLQERSIETMEGSEASTVTVSDRSCRNSNSSNARNMTQSELCQICFIPATALVRIFHELSQYLLSLGPRAFVDKIQQYPHCLEYSLVKFLSPQDHDSFLSIEAVAVAGSHKKDRKRKLLEV